MDERLQDNPPQFPYDMHRENEFFWQTTQAIRMGEQKNEERAAEERAAAAAAEAARVTTAPPPQPAAPPPAAPSQQPATPPRPPAAGQQQPLQPVQQRLQIPVDQLPSIREAMDSSDKELIAQVILHARDQERRRQAMLRQQEQEQARWDALKDPNFKPPDPMESYKQYMRDIGENPDYVNIAQFLPRKKPLSAQIQEGLLRFKIWFVGH